MGKWPFKAFKVAFSKFSFSWVQKHINVHKIHYGQHVVGPPWFKKYGCAVWWCGVRTCGECKQGNRHPRASARSVVHAGTTTEHLTEIYLPSAKLAASQHCVWAFGTDNPITASSSFGLRPKSKWPTLIAGNLTCTLWMPLEIGSKLFPHHLNSMLITHIYGGQKSMRAPNHWFHTPAVGKSLSNVPKPWSQTPAVGKCLPQCGSRFWNGKKMLKGFGACHKNALIQSFEMSPHLIVWRSHSQTL